MFSLVSCLALQTYLDPVFVASYVPSPLRQRLSGIAGSTSLACWLVLLLPQLIEQWRLKSAEGIAPVFLILWFIGDILNLVGSLWGGLLPQVILLAVWFTFADLLALGFYYYFAKVYPERHRQNSVTDNETSPLLRASPERRPSRKSHSSHRRKSSALEDVVTGPENHSVFVKYVLPLAFVFLAGVVGYLCSSPAEGDVGDDKPDEKLAIGPQICGYMSAILYLGARLPQIYQNYTKKSCKGLSLLLFMFSTLGNITYGLQIVFYRTDWDYLKLNSSWLLGSFGTIAEDLVIFFQFYHYRETRLDQVVFPEEP